MAVTRLPLRGAPTLRLHAPLTAGINACVGLHNQRHFVLFMAWISLACWFVAVLGYSHFWTSIHGSGEVGARLNEWDIRRGEARSPREVKGEGRRS